MARETRLDCGEIAARVWTASKIVLVSQNKTKKDYPPYTDWRMVQVWGGRSLVTRRPVLETDCAAPPGGATGAK